MRNYKINLLKRGPAELDIDVLCESDDDALMRAVGLVSEKQEAEIWEGTRLVARVVGRRPR